MQNTNQLPQEQRQRCEVSEHRERQHFNEQPTQRQLA